MVLMLFLCVFLNEFLKLNCGSIHTVHLQRQTKVKPHKRNQHHQHSNKNKQTQLELARSHSNLSHLISTTISITRFSINQHYSSCLTVLPHPKTLQPKQLCLMLLLVYQHPHPIYRCQEILKQEQHQLMKRSYMLYKKKVVFVYTTIITWAHIRIYILSSIIIVSINNHCLSLI